MGAYNFLPLPEEPCGVSRCEQQPSVQTPDAQVSEQEEAERCLQCHGDT